MTPNKDIEGEEREELKKLNRGVGGWGWEANCHVIHSVEGFGEGGGWVDVVGVPSGYNSPSPCLISRYSIVFQRPPSCSHRYIAQKNDSYIDSYNFIQIYLGGVEGEKEGGGGC